MLSAVFFLKMHLASLAINHLPFGDFKDLGIINIFPKETFSAVGWELTSSHLGRWGICGCHEIVVLRGDGFLKATLVTLRLLFNEHLVAFVCGEVR